MLWLVGLPLTTQVLKHPPSWTLLPCHQLTDLFTIGFSSPISIKATLLKATSECQPREIFSVRPRLDSPAVVDIPKRVPWNVQLSRTQGAYTPRSFLPVHDGLSAVFFTGLPFFPFHFSVLCVPLFPAPPHPPLVTSTTLHFCDVFIFNEHRSHSATTYWMPGRMLSTSRTCLYSVLSTTLCDGRRLHPSSQIRGLRFASGGEETTLSTAE